MRRKILIPAALTLSTALPLATAADRHDNPFALRALGEGYLVADSTPSAADRSTMKDAAVAESESGKPAKKKSKNAESKCGEAKCGGNGR